MTKLEFADLLDSYGITDLAREIRENPDDVRIDDTSHFTIYERDEYGNRSYGVEYSVQNGYFDDGERPCTEVQLRIEASDSVKEQEWESSGRYALPAGKAEYPEGADIDCPLDLVDGSEEVETAFDPAGDLVSEDRAHDEDFYSTSPDVDQTDMDTGDETEENDVDCVHDDTDDNDYSYDGAEIGFTGD